MCVLCRTRKLTQSVPKLAIASLLQPVRMPHITCIKMKTLKIRGDISFYSGVLEALASYRFSKFELTVPAPQTAQWTVVNCRFYTPRNEVRGGILESPCRPSVRPSVCPAHVGFRRIAAFPLHLSS